MNSYESKLFSENIFDKVVELLIQAKADLNIQDKDGLTSLMFGLYKCYFISEINK